MPDKKRILHLLTADGNWEPFLRVAAMAAALREHGYTSVIAAPDHSRLWELAEAAGVETIDYTLERTINPLRWRSLGAMITETGAGIVHAHDADSAALLSRAGMFSASTSVVTTRYDLRTPIASAEHGSNVGAVICPSNALAEAFRQRKVPEDKLHVVPAGATLTAADRAGEERSAIRNRYRELYCPGKEKPLFIVNIAPLDEPAAQSVILEAMPDIMAALPQTHLFIMGEGPIRPELERQVKITALANDVTFLEPDKAFLRLLAGADLYVSTDKNDVSGFMLQAAMASGRAAVARNAGCCPEVAENDKTAVLVDGEGGAGFKVAMLDLLENRSRREHLGRQAKTRAANQFAMPDAAGKIAAIYSILG